MANEILSDPEAPGVRVLCKILTMMDLTGCAQSTVKEMKILTTRMIEVHFTKPQFIGFERPFTQDVPNNLSRDNGFEIPETWSSTIGMVGIKIYQLQTTIVLNSSYKQSIDIIGVISGKKTSNTQPRHQGLLGFQYGGSSRAAAKLKTEKTLGLGCSNILAQPRP